MGNSVEVSYQTTPSHKHTNSLTNARTKLPLKSNHSPYYSNFTHQNTQPIRLSLLRGKLSAAECFYTLSTLIQQYYSLFKLYRKVVVSDYLCLVNQFGEIKVDFCIDGPETPLLDYDQVTHCLVTAISHIVSLVERLASCEELQGRESIRFRQELVERVQHCHSSQEETYHAVMQLLTSFLEGNGIRCNLIDSFLRYWSESKSEKTLMRQEQTPFLANSRINQPVKHSLSTNNLNHEYYAEYTQSPKRNEETITRQSHFEEQRNSNKIHSKYRHKMVRTEGENYYIAMSKRNECAQPSSFFAEETSNTRFQKTAYNRISHQYTLNILNSANQERPQGGLKKGTRHNKSTISLKSNERVDRNPNRRQTSLHEFTEFKIDEHSLVSVGKSYAKSMLEQLARSVSIRDEPNSRDHIN